MSPTFRALNSYNYRLWLSGSIVSNIGTWMQRVAQDWLVLTHPDPALGARPWASPPACSSCRCCCSRRTAAWSPTGSRKRRLLHGDPGADGRCWPSAWACSPSPASVAAVDGLRASRSCSAAAAAFDAPARQTFVSEMVGPERPVQRGRPQLRDVQRRPPGRPRRRRPADRAAVGHRLGVPDQRGQLRRGAGLAGPHAHRASCSPRRCAQRAQGQLRDGFRYVRSRPRHHADPGRSSSWSAPSA